jgi:hypothetical protein
MYGTRGGRCLTLERVEASRKRGRGKGSRGEVRNGEEVQVPSLYEVESGEMSGELKKRIRRKKRGM